MTLSEVKNFQTEKPKNYELLRQNKLAANAILLRIKKQLDESECTAQLDVREIEEDTQL